MVSEIGIVAGQHDDRRLEAVLAQNAHRLATVDVRQPHIHDHQVDLPGFGGLNAFGAVFRGHRVELLVQRELLGQRVTQFGVVIDDQNFARVRHSFETPWDGRPPSLGRCLRS